MRNNEADIDLVKCILMHCERINSLVDRFGDDYGIFLGDIAYRDSVSMNLLQIGEMAGKLSEDYRVKTSGMVPWKAIRGMRNLFAHDYGNMDESLIWQTVRHDIPKLILFCRSELST